MPKQQSHTLPSSTSRHTSQNLAKSVPAPPEKKFNFFLPSLWFFNFSPPTTGTKTVGQKQRKPLLDKA